MNQKTIAGMIDHTLLKQLRPKRKSSNYVRRLKLMNLLVCASIRIMFRRQQHILRAPRSRCVL